MNKKKTISEIRNTIKKLNLDETLEFLYSIENDKRKSILKMIRKYESKKKENEKEILRLHNISFYEKRAYKKGFRLIAGTDEAGRGPLAGPVVAAAVILPHNLLIKGVNDSKKITSQKREYLYELISKKAIALSTGISDVGIIDSINILNATKKAMRTALLKLDPKPEYVLIDALKLYNIKIPQESIIKGDSKSISIAAASIVAKVTRDRLLEKYHKIYPEYGFKKHKGYGTKQHINAIKKYGICPIHRVSFTKKFIS